MAFSLTTLEVSSSANTFQSRGFRNNIEDHLTWLISHPSSIKHGFDPHLANVYIGDFYGLLQAINIQPHLHWIILRMNGLHSTLDYKGDTTEVLLPDEGFINTLISRFTSTISV